MNREIRIRSYLTNSEEFELLEPAVEVRKKTHNYETDVIDAKIKYTFGLTQDRLVYLDDDGEYGDLLYDKIQSIETGTVDHTEFPPYVNFMQGISLWSLFWLLFSILAMSIMRVNDVSQGIETTLFEKAVIFGPLAISLVLLMIAIGLANLRDESIEHSFSKIQLNLEGGEEENPSVVIVTVADVSTKVTAAIRGLPQRSNMK